MGQKIETFVSRLNEFNKNLKFIDGWMLGAEGNLNDITNHSDQMTPEDRVSHTMELQEDVASKVVLIKQCIAEELELLPQGDKVPQDAEDHKEELKRIETFVTDLQQKVMKQCDAFSEDVKFWAEYRTGIKSFKPWLEEAEKRATGGLSKPQTLDEANAMYASTSGFDESCLKHIKLLTEAEGASKKMTTHKEADDEVAALKERYAKVKAVSDEWMKKVDTLVKEWKLLDNTVVELIPGLQRIVMLMDNKLSLLKRWNPLWASSRTSSRRRKSLLKTYKLGKQICKEIYSNKHRVIRRICGLDFDFKCNCVVIVKLRREFIKTCCLCLSYNCNR